MWAKGLFCEGIWVDSWGQFLMQLGKQYLMSYWSRELITFRFVPSTHQVMKISTGDYLFPVTCFPRAQFKFLVVSFKLLYLELFSYTNQDLLNRTILVICEFCTSVVFLQTESLIRPISKAIWIWIDIDWSAKNIYQWFWNITSIFIWNSGCTYWDGSGNCLVKSFVCNHSWSRTSFSWMSYLSHLCRILSLNHRIIKII